MVKSCPAGRGKTDMDSRPLNGDNLLFSTSEQAVQRVASRLFSRRERKTVIVIDREPRGRQERGERGG